MYKKILIGGLFMSMQLAALELNVLVDKIDTQKGGDIVVYIFQKEGFPKVHEQALYKKSKSAKTDKLDFKFELTKELKELAIKVHHDENSDTKVTKNWTGIYPKEGLGFSNEQKLGMFGPPSYKNSRVFMDDKHDKINISVVYP